MRAKFFVFGWRGVSLVDDDVSVQQLTSKLPLRVTARRTTPGAEEEAAASSPLSLPDEREGCSGLVSFSRGQPK